LSEVYDFVILYHQLIVCDPTTAWVPNDWQDRHVAQGFSWRPGTVSFSTLGDLGTLRVEVLVGDELVARPDAVRATVVPFAVSQLGLVELSDTAGEEAAPVPPGEYALLCEMGYLSKQRGQEAEWCRLTFVPGRDAQPEILRADADLSPQYPLLMEADPVWLP
jgi:Competence protein J (ComJ)